MRKDMLELILAGVLGLVIGGGSVAVILKPKPEEKPVEKIAGDQQEIIKKLTDFD